MLLCVASSRTGFIDDSMMTMATRCLSMGLGEVSRSCFVLLRLEGDSQLNLLPLPSCFVLLRLEGESQINLLLLSYSFLLLRLEGES